MSLEVTVDIADTVTACILTDTTYSPDVAEDLLRRAGEAALRLYQQLPDDTEAAVDDQG